MCSQTADHHLCELQRWTQAATVISEPRGGWWLPPLQPTVLCASAGHCTHLPGSLRSPPLLSVPRSGEIPQKNAQCPSDCSNFLPASAATGTPPTSQLWLPYPSLSPAWVSKWDLISHCFHSLLPGLETDGWGWPTGRSRAKTKAELQEQCNQRRWREVSPCSHRSSGLNPCNRLGKPCTCEIYE